jgi:hypothetical protein
MFIQKRETVHAGKRFLGQWSRIIRHILGSTATLSNILRKRVFFLSCAYLDFKGTVSGETVVDMRRWRIRFDSAMLQSTQWIINASYNQCSLQWTLLFTVWFNHQIWGHTCLALPNACRWFCARTFSTVITTSMVQDLNEKNRWRWLYDALIIHCVARIVAEP